MALEPVRPSAPEPRRPLLGWFPTEAERRVYRENTDALVAGTRIDSARLLMRRKRIYTDELADIINQRQTASDSPLEVLSAERDYLEWVSVSSGILQTYV
jgi:hypothetical protein